MPKKVLQSGQALLVVVLVMAIALTIGLAVVSRSITQIGLSSKQEKSNRVFTAAEAGLEEAFRTNNNLPSGFFEGLGMTSGNVTSITCGGESEYSMTVKDLGEIKTVWLVGHNGDDFDSSIHYEGTQLDIYWVNANGNTCDAYSDSTPALETSIIFKKDTSGEVKVARNAVDCFSGRSGDDNQFDNCTGTNPATPYNIANNNFCAKKTLDLPVETGFINYALRLRLLYNGNSQKIAVQANPTTLTFPVQGGGYQSTAVDNQGITRSIKRCETFLAPPAIFDYLLYSGTSITKN